MKVVTDSKGSKALSLLRDAYATRHNADRSYSLRRFANELGYKNPSMVSAIFNGKRRLQVDIAARMASKLDIDEEVAHEIKLLVMCENSSSQTEREYLETLIGRKTQQSSYLLVSQDKFRFIADWYHLAVYASLKLASPVFKATDLARKIKVSVSPVVVENALQRLVRLGFIWKSDDGSYQPKTRELYIDSVDHGDDAIKKYHLDTLKIATDMISQPTDRRDLRSSCLAVKKSDLANIKKLSKEFHERLHEFSCDRDADEVVIINTQICSIVEDQQPYDC